MNDSDKLPTTVINITDKIKSNQKIPDDLSLYNGIKTLRFALKLNDFKL